MPFGSCCSEERSNSQLPLQTGHTRPLRKEQKSRNRFTMAAWNIRMLLSTVCQGREKGKADPKKLTKALRPNNDGSRELFRCPIRKSALS